MPVNVMSAFERRFGVTILEGFGLSETSPVASFTMLERPRKSRARSGYPVWGIEMGIIDEHDALLPDGERGEIVIRGHNVMRGYWKRPDANKETLRNGWFHSGDIGFRDADGCYFIVDRKKDMNPARRFQRVPARSRRSALAHRRRRRPPLIGVAHDSHGEEVKAVVALKPGAKASAKNSSPGARNGLAAYKYPRTVAFVDALRRGRPEES